MLNCHEPIVEIRSASRQRIFGCVSADRYLAPFRFSEFSGAIFFLASNIFQIVVYALSDLIADRREEGKGGGGSERETGARFLARSPFVLPKINIIPAACAQAHPAPVRIYVVSR